MRALLLGAAALFAFSSTSFAQAAKPAETVKPAEVAKLAADIKGDAAKLKSYCEMQDLYNQSYEAGEKKDEKKAEELANKADDLGKGLGGDYEKIMNAGADIDPESKEGQEFYAGFEDLDKSCEKK
ncbi:MAG: hypothetical protein SGJ17_09165 [Hyphomicrobiales bacterium]|nr:hypothetical protein [Hyphomicrobiales bacterium]MDZ4791359.1 hypothetical protein [Hyphomicrobiales bacterium]